MSSHLWWVHVTLFPTTCWAMNVCELTLAVSHPPHRRRTGGSGGATRRGVWSDLGGVSQLTLAPTILSSFLYLFFYFVIRLPLCNKYSDYCDIYLYTLCYYICCLLGACMRYTWLCSLKPGVTNTEKCNVLATTHLRSGKKVSYHNELPYG
jgi:hypothetical protein